MDTQHLRAMVLLEMVSPIGSYCDRLPLITFAPQQRRSAIAAPLTDVVRACRPFPRLLRLVWAAHPGYAAASLILTLLSSDVPPIQIWVSKRLIDGVVEAIRADGAGQAVVWHLLLAPVALMLCVWMLGAACQSLSIHVRMLLSIASHNHAMQLILSKAAAMDLAFFETPAFYDRLDNAATQAHRAHDISYALFHVVGSLTSLVGMLALLATSLHRVAIPVLLLTAIPEAVTLGACVNRRHRVWAGRTRLRRLSRYLSQLLTSRDAFKDIRLFGLARPFLDRYADAGRRLPRWGAHPPPPSPTRVRNTARSVRCLS